MKNLWLNYLNTKCDEDWGLTWDTKLSDAINWIDYAIDR